MNTKIADLMTSPVMTTTPHQTMGHVKSVLNKHSASCMPVVNSDGEPVGMIVRSHCVTCHVSPSISTVFVLTRMSPSPAVLMLTAGSTARMGTSVCTERAGEPEPAPAGCGRGTGPHPSMPCDTNQRLDFH